MKPIRIGCTGKSRDDLIYTFEDGHYTLFKVVSMTGTRYLCKEYNISGKTFNKEPTLQFQQVGVFNNHGFKTEKITVRPSEIKGKVFSLGAILMTIPSNVLLER